MATLREYYETDIKIFKIGTEWKFRKPENACETIVNVSVGLSFESNARFLSFFIPQSDDANLLALEVVSNPNSATGSISDDGDGVFVEVGSDWDVVNKRQTNELVYTKFIKLYVDVNLSQQDQQAIKSLGQSKGLVVELFDKQWARNRTAREVPLAFISHDSRDKDSVARGVAVELSKLLCPVWYDEYSLKPGDSLRESIEEGLKTTKKCIVVLSRHFFSNKGWGKKEFDSIYTREIIQKKNVIIPIWHNVTAEEVYEYSPSLADKVALNSSIGVEEIAKSIRPLVTA